MTMNYKIDALESKYYSEFHPFLFKVVIKLLPSDLESLWIINHARLPHWMKTKDPKTRITWDL